MFTLKTNQLFFVLSALVNLKMQQSPAILDLCLTKTRAGKSPDYRDDIVFEKFCFQNVFRPQKGKAGVFKFLSFEERFQKAPF